MNWTTDRPTTAGWRFWKPRKDSNPEYWIPYHLRIVHNVLEPFHGRVAAEWQAGGYWSDLIDGRESQGVTLARGALQEIDEAGVFNISVGMIERAGAALEALGPA